ncbi:TlpA disulfide reductase family protein [Proteiniphilum sp.]|uniref:TlpA disulfide reductase family protein n=1 Tax=Proteiniphilum sp. TaxID=1926877 RepID=UPI002B21C78D|nr:TlpA disulfide reductase family protein [Proteiniphilum sp.]MEA4917301.1 TlpA disulfide reductase family protein [Proteiniphilum sp.]
MNTRIKRKLHITCITLTFIFMACTQQYTVRGYIEGLTNDTIFVAAVSLNNFGEQEPIQDTIYCKKGRFNYSFANDGAYGLMFSFPQFFILDRPTGGRYTPDNSNLAIFLEAGDKISFRGYIDSSGISHVTISGTKLNRDYSTIQNRMFEINKNQVEEEMAFEQAMVDRDNEREDLGRANRQKRLNARQELYGNFIRTNLDNPLSAFLLSQQPLDSLDIYYHKLGENARNSIFHSLLDGVMEQSLTYTNAKKAVDEVVVGSKAPDFMLNDINGQPFNLSSLQGKYIIIDFWGSWCGPCIAGFAQMKSLYEKHKSKLEIVGVACNEEAVAGWKEAVKQHELPWINVYDDKSSAINVSYGVMAFPTKIVIDPEGTIIIREQGEGKNFYTQIESVIQ